MDINNIQIKTITAPALNDANFGTGLLELFKNINENFKLLSNRDFIKGDTGSSVKFEKVILNKDVPDSDYRKILYSDIKSKIENQYGVSENDQIRYKSNSDGKETTLKWDDNLDGLEVTIIKLESNNLAITSLPIILIDNRFANIVSEELNTYLDPSNGDNPITQALAYTDQVDVTSILYLEPRDKSDINSEYKVTIVQNAYPTLYYNNNINDFCWKYHGSNTTLPARGPKGEDKTAQQNMFNVKIKDENLNEIIEIFWNGGWKTTSEYKELIELGQAPEITNHSLAVVFKEKNTDFNYWISQISVTSTGNYIVYCTEENSIKIKFTKAIFNDCMNFINPSESSDIKSLHLPSKPLEESDDTHTIFTNNLGELNIGTINNYGEKNWENNPNSIKNSHLNIWNETDFKKNVNILENKLFLGEENVSNKLKKIEENEFLIFDGFSDIPEGKINTSMTFDGSFDEILYNTNVNNFIFKVQQAMIEPIYYLHHVTLSPRYDVNKIENNKIFFNRKDKQLYCYNLKLKNLVNILNIINQTEEKLLDSIGIKNENTYIFTEIKNLDITSDIITDLIKTSNHRGLMIYSNNDDPQYRGWFFESVNILGEFSYYKNFEFDDGSENNYRNDNYNYIYFNKSDNGYYIIGRNSKLIEKISNLDIARRLTRLEQSVSIDTKNIENKTNIYEFNFVPENGFTIEPTGLGFDKDITAVYADINNKYPLGDGWVYETTNISTILPVKKYYITLGENTGIYKTYHNPNNIFYNKELNLFYRYSNKNLYKINCVDLFNKINNLEARIAALEKK